MIVLVLRIVVQTLITKIQNSKIQSFLTLDFPIHFGYVLSWIYFTDRNQVRFLNEPIRRVCWPVFFECKAIDSILIPNIFYLIVVGLLSSTMLMFLAMRKGQCRKNQKILHALQLILFFSFIAIDYQLKLNQHLILIFFSVIRIFLDKSKSAYPLFIVLVYFSAGFLKFDPDWLSGKALFRPIPFLEGIALFWSLRYVIVLELCVSWLLLFKNSSIRIVSLVQFFLFHVLSFFVVGFYYPILMIVLLTPLVSDQGFNFKELALNRRLQILVAIFVLAQILPHLLSSNPTLTAQSRSLAFHMFDSRLRCKATLTFKKENENLQFTLPMSNSPRLACDPIVFRAQVANICLFQNISSLSPANAQLYVARTTDINFVKIADLDYACDLNRNRPSIVFNSWIQEPAY